MAKRYSRKAMREAKKGGKTRRAHRRSARRAHRKSAARRH